MLKEWLAKVTALLGKVKTPFDPARFNDPVAMQTEWTPLKPGGANFCTHRLQPVGLDRMEFKLSIGGRLFGSVFLFAGLACSLGFAAAYVYGSIPRQPLNLIMPAIIGLIFAVAGGSMLYFMGKPVVFDKRIGCFWKGRTSPAEVVNRQAIKVLVPIDQVHALQIVSERCSGSKGSSYYSYELNLILHDGARVNVVDHGHLAKLRTDAGQLAQFLGVPLWVAVAA